MKKFLLFITLLTFLISCSSNDDFLNTEWVFIACEGNYGSSNGSVYMINEFGKIDSISNLGDVVQSVEVYDDKLFVLVNNSHKLHVFDINEYGVSFPGIEIDLDGSSPREMVVDDNRLYFSNWNSKDVKYLDLFTYKVEKLLDIDGLPEGIAKKGSDLFIAVNMNEDYSSSNKVVRYSTDINTIVDVIEVGDGPLDIEFKNDEVYVSRTYYDENYTAYHGTSQFSVDIDDNVLIKNYGENTPCGGSIHNIDNTIYRSALGGIVELDDLLDLKVDNKIGDFNQSEVYAVEVIGDKVYFALTDFNKFNKIKILNKENMEVASYNVGIIPGDFTVWTK